MLLIRVEYNEYPRQSAMIPSNDEGLSNFGEFSLEHSRYCS